MNEIYHIIQGKYSTSTGSTANNDYLYSGQIMNGSMFGLGKMTLYEKNTSNKKYVGKYEGRFKNNLFHGDNGRYVVGNFEFIGSYKNNNKLKGYLSNITRECLHRYEEGKQLKCDNQPN